MKEKELKQALYNNKDIMYRLALSILKCEADAEDALQDVFVKCWDQRSQLNIKTDIKGYLMQSTRNRCLDMIKKHNRKYEQSGPIYEYIASAEADSVELDDQISWIDIFLKQLPEINQTIFHMREVEGISFENIAEILQYQTSNVRTILSRTKKHLRNRFTQINYAEKRKIKTGVK